MNPGDIIEWRRRRDESRVAGGATLWSNVLHRYVPIGSLHVHVLVAFDEVKYAWVSELGTWRALKSDSNRRITMRCFTMLGPVYSCTKLIL